MTTHFFQSQLPKIKLVGAIQDPYDLSVATARTCYSSKGIITVDEVSKDEKSRVLRDRISDSTREAGHLTTRQHAHFVFSMDHVSRSFLWSFLHSHPFYNSEQVSQRYVKVKPGNFTIPTLSTPKNQSVFQETLELQMKAYENLIELVLPTVKAAYFKVFKSRKEEKRWMSVIHKKAYEVARYILPISTQAYLYHTVSALTLMRYYKMAKIWDTPSEQLYVVQKMIDEVVKIDPDFQKELSKPFDLDSVPEYQWALPAMQGQNFSQAKAFVQEFDEALNGKVSKLVDQSENAEATLAQAVRNLFSKTKAEMTDEAAIDLVLHPKQNPMLGDTFNVSTLSKLTRALFHVHFSFQKKISHTADSQDQRHRMTPGSRPILALHYFGEPDVIYPKVLLEVPKAKALFEDVLSQTVQNVNTLLKAGEGFEKAHYLLPNAWAIRFIESGDLLNWHHKWKLRTCYNAQEEIFYASVAELLEVEKKFPLIARHIKAPCYIRSEAKLKPYCPEGDHFCGVPVWKLNLSQYDRMI